MSYLPLDTVGQTPQRCNRPRTMSKDRPGVAASEAALVLPLLGLILIGMFELSRGMMAKETLSDAARKGCSTGIQSGKGNTDIYTDVINIMRDNGYDATKFNPVPPGTGTAVGSITITLPTGYTDALTVPSGSQIGVQVSIPVSSIAWVSTFFLKSSSVESETVYMMKKS